MHKHTIRRTKRHIFNRSSKVPQIRRVLPPISKLRGLDHTFHNTTVMSLRSTQQDLTVETTKDVVITDVAVVGACDEVSHAEGGCKGVGWDGVRDGADGFDCEGFGPGEILEELEFAKAGGRGCTFLDHRRRRFKRISEARVGHC